MGIDNASKREFAKGFDLKWGGGGHKSEILELY